MIRDFEAIIKLSDDEEEKFAKFIQAKRKQLILPPKDTARKAMESNKEEIEGLLKNKLITESITKLRQYSYDEFLLEESHFNGVVLSEIAKKFNAPQKILHNISLNLHQFKDLSQIDFQEKVRFFFGEFAGCISPYIYQLCLSNTQSRRSRAGKVFEGIIYFLYEYFGFSYDSQASIGKKAFSSLGLGKVVDSILPSTKAFQEFRNKTIVGSMKTTLRERWQEVVEEISRSNLPNIYLLTVDDDISTSKAKQMAEHNIVLVVRSDVKTIKHLNDMRNIIDFETYFDKEIPSVINYWGKCSD
ncbi:type II restriction endonuclease [Cysteiniphilum sp. JM-1]|uniref:type II restriction endonuclease n=1 Tax=Cysteiniphilum sp. JM-1 TaxID=2610891 RepID=UPI001244EAF9|nr:type II restriction endonuclease [Cysteiniphilum sp. JM-1]